MAPGFATVNEILKAEPIPGAMWKRSIEWKPRGHSQGLARVCVTDKCITVFFPVDKFRCVKDYK